MHGDGLSETQIRATRLGQHLKIEQAFARLLAVRRSRLGRVVRAPVLPNGPQSIHTPGGRFSHWISQGLGSWSTHTRLPGPREPSRQPTPSVH